MLSVAADIGQHVLYSLDIIFAVFMFLTGYLNFSRLRLSAAMCASLVAISGCGVLREQQTPSDMNVEVAERAVQKPLSPEETEAMLGDVASNWFYGQGLGETMLTAGTVFLFPPYAIYVAGNAALSLSGYHELRVSEALPDTEEDIWNSVYDGVTSVPGRMTSVVAGEEYVSRRAAGQKLDRYLNREADEGAALTQSDGMQETVKAWR